ncbi:sialate O-acetylesterase [cf. Phormidesmis sp. LEGE 11477]|uniref:sialate O-acetylesterase n=1 Tax=cf. Phormidesmis sp. LEGE 11477 TaxID=1828680 RepID=UPI00187E0689|nr:sialate O-acetylesterase [cf. Phormidesmis sp. LEGE 11477]MBE9060792.1 sialate O-acetylesterase [cf. Phormidesmis sp. LEGE 11477]
MTSHSDKKDNTMKDSAADRMPRFLMSTGFALLVGVGLGVLLQSTLGIGKNAMLFSRSSNAEDPDSLPATIPEQLQGKLELYVLIGQSNMVGTADIPADIGTSANIYTFGNDYRWQIATAPVDDATNQVDTVSIDEEAKFGPALPFAQTLIAQDNNQIIGLIPCARSGSSISDWQKNLSDQTLYGSCLKRVRAASTVGTVSGILFFQGETDAVDPEQFPNLNPDPSAWAEKFATFAYNFRADIGNSNLPLIYAQLGQPSDLEELPYWEAVQQQQASLQIPNTVVIATADLPMEGVHFTAESYQKIGERFAIAISSLP